MHNPRRQGRASGFALYLLLAQMAHVGFDKIPPVTLVSIAAQAAIFLQLFNVPWLRYGLNNVCISALHVWYQNDWKRLIFATFYHADEWHLYFNMVSMLWKGIKLEKKFGSLYFCGLLAVFSVLVNVILVALSICADELFDDHSYLTQCAVGFSGVLFALKVVLNDMDPTGVQYVMGFPVPSKLVCWAELILIHIMVPNASFLGHLSGIIVGLLYVKGPLKPILHIIFQMFTGQHVNAPSYRTRNRTTWGSGVTGTRDHQSEQTGHRNRDHFNTYTGGMSEEEQMHHAMQQSTFQRNTTGQGGTGSNLHSGNAPNLDDIRTRRLNRFATSS